MPQTPQPPPPGQAPRQDQPDQPDQNVQAPHGPTRHVTVEEVRRIARLARLALEPAEEQRLAADLARILEYVSRLEALDLPSGNPWPESGESPRADEPVAPLDQQQALGGAPRARDGHFIVPRVVG